MILAASGSQEDVSTYSWATVDALARLALAARRRGCQLRLRGLPRELRELIELAGLTAVLGLEPRREAEEREERLGVEEEGELGDPVT
jgi:anti-anti-sigma regulatory factor